MIKSFKFHVAALLLVMHGATMSMMHTAKTLRTTSLLKSNRNLHSMCGYNKDSIAILQSLQTIEQKLEEQNKLLQNLQENAVKSKETETGAYALQQAKIEARCKILIAPGLDASDRAFLYAMVDGMHRE